MIYSLERSLFSLWFSSRVLAKGTTVSKAFVIGRRKIRFFLVPDPADVGTMNFGDHEDARVLGSGRNSRQILIDKYDLGISCGKGTFQEDVSNQ